MTIGHKVPVTESRAQADSSAQREWAIKAGAFVIILVLVIIVGSGRYAWWMGWLYIALTMIGMIYTTITLQRKSPDLIAERSHPGEGIKPWDRVLVRLAAVWLPFATWILCALDNRFRWSAQIPMGLQWLGLVLSLSGYWLTNVSMMTNRFFSSVVRIQDDRGHRVVDRGVYRVVRHPGYVGAMLNVGLTPLALNALWALVPALAVVALYVLRTALEDAMLQEELPGYAAYAQRTRYRLLPGVW